MAKIKASTMKQMAREIHGYVVHNGGDFYEVFEDYTTDIEVGGKLMTAAQIDKLETVYYEMKNTNQFHKIEGVQ